MIFSIITIISGRIWLGNGVAMVFLFVVTMIDYQVYYFRGTEILPGDLGSIRTAIGVAGQYHPKITSSIVIAVLLLLVYLMMLRLLVHFRKGLFWRGIYLVVLLGSFVIFISSIDNVALIIYRNEGMKQNSFPVNFCRVAYGLIVKEPDGYSYEIVKELDPNLKKRGRTQCHSDS